MDETMTINAPRQLISFVLDNSASCEREKLAALMQAFRRFAAVQTGVPLEWELICYDGLSPAVVKSFEDDEIRPVFADRLPLLSRALETASGRLLARVSTLEREGVQTYRPLLILLCDGFALDDAEKTVCEIDAAEREGRITYLPFRLRHELLCDRVCAVDRIKHLIEICDGRIDGLFQFLETVLVRRAETSSEQPMHLGKEDFEGWALL